MVYISGIVITRNRKAFLLNVINRTGSVLFIDLESMVDRQVAISITLRNKTSPIKRVHKFAWQKGQFYKKLKKRVTTVNLQILTKGFK